MQIVRVCAVQKCYTEKVIMEGIGVRLELTGTGFRDCNVLLMLISICGLEQMNMIGHLHISMDIQFMPFLRILQASKAETAIVSINENRFTVTGSLDDMLGLVLDKVTW